MPARKWFVLVALSSEGYIMLDAGCDGTYCRTDVGMAVRPLSPLREVRMTNLGRGFLRRALLAISAASLLVLVSAAMLPPTVAGPAVTNFAAPAIMIFSGGPLQGRVVLDDFSENLRLLSGTRVAEMSAVRGPSRPFIPVWLYWGPQWRPTVGNQAALDRLGAADANQRGKFYPAWADESALLVLEPTLMNPVFSARQLDSAAVAILRRRGVPVRVQ